MKKSLELSLFLVLSCSFHNIFCQGSENDMFPLRIDGTWTYQFNSEERFSYKGMLRWMKTRSGVVQFNVLSEATIDTLKNWGVEAVDSLLVHHQDLYPYPGDTSYVSVNRDTFFINESLFGNHQLISDSCSAI